MKELLLKKATSNSDNPLSIVDPSDYSVIYSLLPKNEALLTKYFVIQSKSGDPVADIKMEHVMFTPGKMPKLTLSAKDGRHFIVKKEIEQLSDAINVVGENLSVRGNLFSGHFELICQNECIADFNYTDTSKLIRADENYELLAIMFAFAVELVK